MRRAIRLAVEAASQAFDPPSPIVELGSWYQPGSAWLGDLRPLFPNKAYTGCDIRPGPGVDRLENAEALRFEDGSVGTVIVCEVLEHLRRPHRAVAEARRVLRSDGLLIVSVPFQYRLHGFPSDYWRFTSAGLRVLLEPFAVAVVCGVGPRLKPAFSFAVASPAASPRFDDGAALFRELLTARLARTRLRGFRSAFVERARDFAGLLLGRADLGAAFLDPDQPAHYRSALGSPPEGAGHEG